MPVCSLLVFLFLNVFFCTVNEGKARHQAPVLIQPFVWRFRRRLHNLLTRCCVCLLVSGLVHAERGGAVCACCPGLPAGQVSGQTLRC